MQRTIVQVMQVRMADVLPGDIVNKNHGEPRGWFAVVELQELPNGGVVIAAASDRDSINGTVNDIVGVQITKIVEVPSAVARAA